MPYTKQLILADEQKWISLTGWLTVFSEQFQRYTADPSTLLDGRLIHVVRNILSEINNTIYRKDFEDWCNAAMGRWQMFTDGTPSVRLSSEMLWLLAAACTELWMTVNTILDIDDLPVLTDPDTVELALRRVVTRGAICLGMSDTGRILRGEEGDFLGR